MTRLSVQGIGVTGAFGAGVEALLEALEKGGVTPGELSVPVAQGTVTIPAFRADTARLEEFVPKRTLRRVDRYSKLALTGACLALADGGLFGGNLDRVGVIVASGYGATATTFAFLDSIIADGDVCASPTHFANSVHNSAAANISIMLAAKGPSLTVSQFGMSAPSALVTARQWLEEKRVDYVLLGAVDELSDLVGYLQYRRRGAHPAHSPSPLKAEESSVVGEGAAFLLLAREDAAPGYCHIDAVATGNVYAGAPSLPQDAVFFPGADGRSDLYPRYRAAIPDGLPLACYAPLYGSMPAAAAFDLACAALCLKRGRIFPLPGGAGCDFAGNAAPLKVSRICALRFEGESEFACVELSAP